LEQSKALKRQLTMAKREKETVPLIG